MSRSLPDLASGYLAQNTRVKWSTLMMMMPKTVTDSSAVQLAHSSCRCNQNPSRYAHHTTQTHRISGRRTSTGSPSIRLKGPAGPVWGRPGSKHLKQSKRSCRSAAARLQLLQQQQQQGGLRAYRSLGMQVCLPAFANLQNGGPQMTRLSAQDNKTITRTAPSSQPQFIQLSHRGKKQRTRNNRILVKTPLAKPTGISPARGTAQTVLPVRSQAKTTPESQSGVPSLSEPHPRKVS
ncbi:hypothetical protein CCHR01_01800 [Colletotrichum chrysophilum]|uniref:Uncharacterized protein n=1 Tax=Colletotrichum chrysophilum TaxID=1836956 RepID=A0AAD9AZM2_9PEZI|nr:hypothetical protein CCHR01_01800 [Colletotrichum chrysophilum]